MKKTLVAVAALVATGAFAEVTIGGHFDQGYQTTKTETTGAASTKVTALAPANAASFLAFTGSEDLGSGMKASFRHDMAFNMNTGVGTTTNRESWVALSGAFGTVTAGAQYSSLFWNTLATDPAGFNNLVGWGPGAVMIAGIGAANGALVGSGDTITYALPTLVEGVAISTQSIRPSAGVTGNSTLISYKNGGLYAGYTMRKVGNDSASSAAASYDLGVAKVGYSSIDATIATLKTTDSTITVSAPLGSATTVGLSMGSMSVNNVTTNNSQMGAYYNLSKRTQLYGLYGKASAAATTTTQTSFGLHHSF